MVIERPSAVVAMTLTWGMTAPEGSVMRPRTVPVEVCAVAAAVIRTRKRNATSETKPYPRGLAGPLEEYAPSLLLPLFFVINRLDRKRRQVLPLIGLYRKLFHSNDLLCIRTTAQEYFHLGGVPRSKISATPKVPGRQDCTCLAGCCGQNRFYAAQQNDYRRGH